MKTFPAILLTLAVAIPVTWFAARKLQTGRDSAASSKQTPASGERKLLFYQSAMHPWIKSDKPGRCTICGMELTPVYEGESSTNAPGGDVVALSQTMIQVMNVQTAEVKIQPLTRKLEVAGMIEENATKHRVISTYLAGRVEKLYLNYLGAEVKEGQPLADFYSPALLQAEREYRALTGELRQAKAVALRQLGLSAKQIEALATKPAEQLTSQILAPIGGTVVAQNVSEGQFVQEGERLFEIADFSTVWFQFRAYEQDLPWIKAELKVDITTPSHPGKKFSGRIAFVDPNFDDATRSTKVRVELENPLVEGRRQLLNRLYADGVVHLEAPEVLAIPRTAVIQTGREAVAYVDQGGGSYLRRSLKLGRRGDVLVEILGGLAAGEKVVVSGNLLMDGQAEMNRSFASVENGMHGPTNTIAPLSESDKQLLEEFVKAADQVSLALSSDQLTNFQAAATRLLKPTEEFISALKPRKELEDLLQHLSEARDLKGAKDLAAARKLFHPFSNVAARLMEIVGNLPGPQPFELFECPMVDRAIPGVPKKGRWVQSAGRSLANPYFGAEMLECGVKVKRQGDQ